jgi:hypothetical protein
MSNLILVNLNIKNMKRPMIVWLFISKLVVREKGDNYFLKNEVVVSKLFL